MERDRRIGKAIEAKWDELHSQRASCGWARKLEACGWFQHRDSYMGTEVAEKRVYDSTPKNYMSKFVSGLCGYLMPEDGIWGKLVPGTSVGGGTRWNALSGEKGELEALEALTGIGFEAMSDSGFSEAIQEVEKDRCAFGHGYIWAIDGWDAGERGVSYKCIDPQEVVISDSYLGSMEVFIRRCKRSAVDVVRTYGKGSSGLERTRALARSGSEREEVEVFEAVLPSDYLVEGGEVLRAGSGKRYAHLVYVREDGELVVESGYEEMPVFQSRRFGDSDKMPYGIGLCEDVLEDVKRLNDLANCRQIIVQKNARPPMVAPTSLQGRFSGKPDSISYVPDVAQAPRPVLQTIDGNSILNDIERLTENLRGLMMVDLFETILRSGGDRKTATEVTMKKNEAMVLLSFQIGAMKRTVLEPLFKRTVKIALRHMRLEDEGARASLMALVDGARFELNSVFIQRLSAYLQNSANDEILMAMQGLSQIYPQAMDTVRMDKWVPHYFRGKGLLEGLVADEGEVEAKRAQRAEIQRAQLESQLGAENAKANAQNAKAEKEMASR